MKAGDLVKNIFPVRTYTSVRENRLGKRYEKGYFGIVTEVRQTDLNKSLNPSGKGDVYVDVTLNVEDGAIYCGNYLAGAFEVVK